MRGVTEVPRIGRVGSLNNELAPSLVALTFTLSNWHPITLSRPLPVFTPYCISQRNGFIPDRWVFQRLAPQAPLQMKFVTELAFRTGPACDTGGPIRLPCKRLRFASDALLLLIDLFFIPGGAPRH